MSAGNSTLTQSPVLSETAPPIVKKGSKAFLLIWPAFLYLLAFMIVYPFLYNIYQSFFQYSMLTGTSRFVGFGNYVSLFTKGGYLASLWVSLIILFFALTIETGLGLSIALVLNQKFRGKVLARMLLILPLGTIPVINAYMFTVIFFPGASVVDHIFNLLGLVKGSINWLTDPINARIVVLATDIWQWTPFMVIMILAGLSSIPESFYELARLDNLSTWKTFWRITLPKIRFTLALAMLIRAMDLLKFFDSVFAVTKGGPQSATETASFYIYRQGFKAFNVGYASAGSIVIWAIIWVLAFVVISRVFTTPKEKAA